MLHTAELLRQTLVPFLWTVGLLLGALFSYLIIRHAVIELFRRRRQRAIVRYRPLIDSITERGLTSQARDQLRRIPARARRVVTSLLLAPLQASRGDVVAHVRDAAVAMGLTAEWRADLESRRWWRRADGVRALGSVREAAALPLMMRALSGRLRSC